MAARYSGRAKAFETSRGPIWADFVHDGTLSCELTLADQLLKCLTPNQLPLFQESLMLSLGQPKGCEDSFLHVQVRMACRDLALGYDPATSILGEDLEWRYWIDAGVVHNQRQI